MYAAIEKILLPGVANKLSRWFPDVQESNAVIRKKGLMELSLPRSSSEEQIEITAIGEQRLRVRQRTHRAHLLGIRRGFRSEPRQAKFHNLLPAAGDIWATHVPSGG